MVRVSSEPRDSRATCAASVICSVWASFEATELVCELQRTSVLRTNNHRAGFKAIDEGGHGVCVRRRGVCVIALPHVNKGTTHSTDISLHEFQGILIEGHNIEATLSIVIDHLAIPPGTVSSSSTHQRLTRLKQSYQRISRQTGSRELQR